MAIRRAPGDQTQFEVAPLFTESTTVIASPQLLDGRALKTPRDLEKAVLLSTESRPGDWENWFSAASCADLRPMQMLRFDHFFVTLQAVVDGMGFGIGAFPTLAADVGLGRLVTPFPQFQAQGSAYFMVMPRDSDKPKHLRDFLAWLREVGERADPGVMPTG